MMRLQRATGVPIARAQTHNRLARLVLTSTFVVSSLVRADEAAVALDPGDDAASPADPRVDDENDETDAGAPSPSPDGLVDEEVSASDADAPVDVPADAPVELPDGLPALDDDLRALLSTGSDGIANAFDGAALVASGRIRLEVDESRDLDAADDLQAGVSMTGKVGAEVPLGPQRARVVVGDGRRFGRDDGNLTHPFVTPDVLAFLYEVSLLVDLPLLGLPTVMEAGRREIVVADGRLVGRAPFDPRGRTLDGALIAAHGEHISARVGAFYLGPYVAVTNEGPSALGIADVRSSGSIYDVTGYVLIERDARFTTAGASALTIPTFGARGLLKLFFVEARAGADTQATLVDGSTTFASAFAGHAEFRVEAAPEFTMLERKGAPVIGVDAEVTGGMPYRDRAFRSPAPDVHDTLGNLDLVDMDNIASARVYVGVQSLPGARALLSARTLAMTDPTLAVHDPLGRVIVSPSVTRTDRLLFTEIDASIALDLGYGLSCVGEYGIAFPLGARGGDRPVQRLLVSIAFDSERPAPLGAR
jgi:hypothetical protein